MAAVVLIAVVVPTAGRALRSDSSPVALLRAAGPGRATPGDGAPVGKPTAGVAQRGKVDKAPSSKPTELHLTRAHSKVFDVRGLKSQVVRRERPEHAAPGEREATFVQPTRISPSVITRRSSPAPAPDSSFEGLDFANWGAGHPPDTNGDVGPTYYIQTINTSIGIYNKSTGVRVAAFTFNTFMSQGAFGNLCDTANFGDPVVLYDSFEDRWFISDFAFTLDGSGNVNPQHSFQCFAVSKTGDPVAGGWNFYSIETPGGLGDYPKFGIWPDGIYMSANMFGYAAGASFQAPHVWALNKAQMYSGDASPQVVDFAAPSADFTVLPANARLQTGTPPAGSPEYFAATEEFLNGQTIYKFHVDWDKISTSTFTGPDVPQASTCWPNSSVANIPTPANSLDALQIRAMAQNQYSNIGGAESLWISHTVRRAEISLASCGATSTTAAAVRWYQVNVTGGTVAANDVQSKTWDPDGTDTFHRWMPSLAVDRAGDMAVGYSKANATTNPQIKYAGRLAADPINTFSQTEQTLIDGTGSQSGNCGPSTCTRWGDYSGMALDPNGCEFWETNEYYQVTGLNHNTRIGSFHFPGCTTVGNGTLSGTVTDGANPISGATVTLGSRSTTTNGSGAYSFTVPAGTYPTETAAKAGFDPSSAATLVVPNGGTLTKNFTLSAAAQSGCFTDNTQSTFQRGAPVNCSLTTSPGNVVLASPDNTATQNSTVSPTGFGITNTAWAGQTFTPTVSGKLNRIDVELFCAGCTTNSPNITMSIRATTGTTPVPTGADLATATLPGFNDGGAGGLKTFTFASPLTVTAGTRYALIFRDAAAFASGTVAYTCSCATTGFSNSNPYASGQFVTSSNSGSTWTADTTVGGRDMNFVTYINPGFASSGTFVSSLKDANPAAGHTATWTTLSFTATTPASTAVKFQIAASNSSAGPFNFVGPDGTAATFFTTSGASLSQFNGLRYLKYKALLSTSDGSVTPSLSSVQVCFVDTAATAPTVLTVAPATGTFGGTTTLSATLTASAVGVSGATVAFTLNGTSAGSATTNASGVATINNASLAGINAGSYPTGVGGSYAGDATHDPSSGSNSLTVAKADQAINVTTHAPASAVFGTSFGVAATGGASGNPVTFSSSGACSNTGATFTMTSGTGTCSVKYDQAGSANYNAAPQLTETVNAAKANQAINVTTHAPASAVFGTSFGVAATGGASGNPVTFSSSGACSNTGATFTMTSGTGTCSVKYDQAGDANYNPANQVTETVNAVKANQAINVTTHAPASAAFGVSFTVAATGGASGNPVTFSNGGVCSNTGATFTMTSGTGTCTVKYDQAGDANYNAAAQVTETVNATKANQAINVTTHAPASAAFGTGFSVAATGGASGNPVTFSSSGACTNLVSSFTMTSGTGTCSVKYDQAGDANYNAAPQVTETVNATKANQTINVTTHAPASAAFNQQFTVAATGGGSGNPVTFSNGGVCSNTGATFTITSGTGTCTVKYDQAGDANYNAAPQVTETVNATKANQAINVTTHAPASAAFGASFTVAATGGASGNPVTFSNGGVCSNTGATFTMTSGTGTCTVKYDQAGDANYNAAAQVTETVNAAKANQVINVTTHAPASAAFNQQFTVAATGGGSGNPVTFSSAGVCTNTGATFTITSGSGTCSVKYDQAGDANYNAAPQVTETVSVGKIDQAITVTTHAPASAVFGTSFTVAATGGGSGNPVTFSSSGSCTNVGATFTMTSGTGTCSVKYDQAGDANYNAAPQVTETVNAAKANQAINVTTHAPASAVFGTGFSVAATGGGSGNPVTFSSSGACTNLVSSFTMTSGTGTCSVKYDQAGDANYNAAPQVTETVNAVKANQAINVTTHAPASAVFNQQFTVAATGGGSGNAVTFSSAGSCSNTGATFTMTSGTGTCTVNYNQAGDANYNAAPQVTETVNAQKANQAIAITLHAPGAAAFGTSFTVAALGGGSGNPVTFSSSGSCTNVAATFTMTSGTGTCTVSYDQAGNANYNAAPQLTESVTAQKASQTINVTTHAPASAAFGATFGVAATGGGSGNPVVFSSAGSCSNTGATFTITSATGTCTVNYDQAGNANYNAAPQVTETVNATKANQTITFAALPDKTVGDPDFTVSATASSGLTVTFTASGNCTVTGTTVHLTGAGSCTITASQGGNANYNAAPDVPRTFAINPSGGGGDTTKPTVNISRPADGTVYPLDKEVTAAFKCKDNESGIASCVGTQSAPGANPVVNGSTKLDTSTLGTHTLSVVGTDNAGNSLTVTIHYTVVYTWNGFFSPIGNEDDLSLNLVHAGDLIKLGFGLNGDRGLDIFAAGSPTSVQVTCPAWTLHTVSGAPAGTPAGLTLAASGHYTYGWQTTGSWAGTCRQFQLKLKDGTPAHTAVFMFF